MYVCVLACAVIMFTIIYYIQDTADVYTVVREAVSPHDQPCIITRVRNGQIKYAFLVVEKAAFPTKVSPKDISLPFYFHQSLFLMFTTHLNVPTSILC